MRDLDEFIGSIATESGGIARDYERAARAVFWVLTDRVSAGEIEDVKLNLAPPIREL
jgi:uncharacterized protein (DUF2267 family)